MITPEQEEDIQSSVVKYAAEHKLFNIIKHIANQKYNIHTDEDIALYYAVKNEDIEMIQFLLDNNANIHAHDDAILNYALQYNHKIYKLLVQHNK